MTMYELNFFVAFLMFIKFKPYVSEGTLKMNRLFGIVIEKEHVASFKPTDEEIKQFQKYSENLIELAEKEHNDELLYIMKKLYVEVQEKFPEEFCNIFSNNNIFELLTNILCDSPNYDCRLYAILILSNATAFSHKAFYGLPYITDIELFTDLMNSPLHSLDENGHPSFFGALFYSNLLYNSLKYSEESARSFYDTGIYNYFIDMCLQLTENEDEIKKIKDWKYLISILSSSYFPMPDEDKFLLIQVYKIFFDLGYYDEYIIFVDHLIDSCSDDLLPYIYDSPIFSELIKILSDIVDKFDKINIESRKICMYALYKMINRDQSHQCDITFLPFNILSQCLEHVDLSDQVASLQLLLISLKKDEYLKMSIIDVFIDLGIYNILMKHLDKYQSETKYLMTEFFILSLIKATQEQLGTFLEYNIFEPTFSNIDCSNDDLLELFDCFLKRFLPNDDLVKRFLLEYSELIFEIADEVDEEKGETIYQICDVLNKFIE